MKLSKIFLYLSAVLTTSMGVFNLIRSNLSADDIGMLILPVLSLLIYAASIYLCLRKDKKTLEGIFAILSGFAVLVSGYFAFATTGAPAPGLIAKFSLLLIPVGFLCFVLFLGTGFNCFGNKD